jgi:hypothetical protein
MLLEQSDCFLERPWLQPLNGAQLVGGLVGDAPSRSAPSTR